MTLTMAPETRSKTRARIALEEGFEGKLYRDTNGHWTGGFGHNFDAKGISLNIGFAMLDEDIQDAEHDVWKYLSEWYEPLTDPRKSVILDMAFNEGAEEVAKFTGMIAAIKTQNWTLAAKEMLQSLWAQQVGNRAVVLAKIMESGQL